MKASEIMSKPRQPQPGDIWEFRRKGRKVRKEVGYLYMKFRSTYDQYGNQTRSWRERYVQWYRAPKGRYTGVFVKWLLENGTLIETKKQRDAKRPKRWAKL